MYKIHNKLREINLKIHNEIHAAKFDIKIFSNNKTKLKA